VGFLDSVLVATTKEPAEQAVVLFLGTWVDHALCSSSGLGEWPGLGSFVGLFFPFVDLLLECFCFLFVGKGQSNDAVFRLKGVKKGSVLIVGKGIRDLLVPDDASIGGLCVC
jgi:hypothetical protein